MAVLALRMISIDLMLVSPWVAHHPDSYGESNTVRITLEELRQTSGLTIELLEILSIEGQQYMARLVIDGDYHLLSDNRGNTRLFRSSWEIQDTLASFNVVHTDVVHPSAYHEMVGMEPATIEPMRIRIQGHHS